VFPQNPQHGRPGLNAGSAYFLFKEAAKGPNDTRAFFRSSPANDKCRFHCTQPNTARS